jgi:hypothetical protein
MKNSILTLVILSLSMSAFADCRDAYEEAIAKRIERNTVIIAAGSVVTLAGGAVLFAGSIFWTTTALGLGGAGISEAIKRKGEAEAGMLSNSFSKLLNDFSALEANRTNAHLSKIISKSLAQSGLEESQENIQKARLILLEGFHNESFCQENRVFKRRELIKYVANLLAQ